MILLSDGGRMLNMACESTKYFDQFDEIRRCEKRKNHKGYHKAGFMVW